MGRFSDADWAKAKRLCRLSRAEVQMARTLGLNPRKLPKQNPSPTQRWKLPVGEWVRALHAERFGEPPDPPPRAARAPQLSAARQPPPAPEPEPLPFGDDAEDFGLESWLEEEPTARELEQDDRYRLRHREAFREAASYVASAFAGSASSRKSSSSAP